jgi:hypothetical protein
MWQINIPCLQCIEVWAKGSPELRFVSVTQNSGEVLNHQIWDQDRSNFTPWNWFQVNKEVLSTWGPSIQGNFMRHHWYEEDGGWSSDVIDSFNLVTTAGVNLPYTITRWGYDDVMNFATVFFGDITWTAYTASGNPGSVHFYMGPF